MRILILTFVLIVFSLPSYADELPYLTGQTDLPQCHDALALGKAMFQSNNLELFAPPIIPDGLQSKVVIQRSKVDISGGDGITYDEKTFDRIVREGFGARPLYWEKNPNSNYRLVLNLYGMGWRGDLMTLYSVPTNVSSEEFIKQIKPYSTKAPYHSIGYETWNPSIILTDKSGASWGISMEGSDDRVPYWAVYATKENQDFQQVCRVYFQQENATMVVPAPIRKLQDLMRGTLGPNQNEGTLQNSARRDIEAQHILKTSLSRPWLVGKISPYNSRIQVDGALQEWAKPVKARYKLYQQIYAQYPTAQKALEQYYIEKFGKTEVEAKNLAATNLDIYFRSYYVFSNH